MKKAFGYFLIFLLLPFLLHADEELVVHLFSKEDRSPLFLSVFTASNSKVDKGYLKKLENVLKFDLDHNGKTAVTDPSKERVALASSEEDLFAFDQKKWHAEQIEYVVKAKVDEKKISASVFGVKDGKLKVMQDIGLTGNLNQDRQTIHQISDAIFEALFQEKGIAKTRILYTVRMRKGDNSSEWTSDIWQADYDGCNARQITHDGALCVTPTFIPTSGGHCNRFLFVSYKIGQPKILLATVGEKEAKRLTYLKGTQLMPAISPLRDKIAFISDISGNPDLFLQDYSPGQGLVGKPRQIFAAPKAAQGSPTFNPDGKKIAFVSNKDGTPRIYVLDIPQQNASLKDLKPKLISKQNRDNTCPAWSPDGKKIAYSAMTEGTRQIWIYDVASKQEIQLTQGAGHKENPTWAPNSCHLIFNSSQTNGTAELYLINLNQKQAVKITSGTGEKRFPAWEHFS